ncbi:hypothetical protein CA984_22905 [Streptosporangium minutum]|uniref:Tyr recombinase domain-containing protein n=2 Tax=Streptosporangium minutum TaxID=569862 RepID=A0A243RHN4_9ACTN|nr:hypothetical protein CA984_22905 [Streptosporangium minutum]
MCVMAARELQRDKRTGRPRRGPILSDRKDPTRHDSSQPLAPGRGCSRVDARLLDLDGTPASIMVWRSVREGGDTKTRKSRRTLTMPKRCGEALKLHRERQDVARKAAKAWQENDLVFASKVGTELDAHSVRRSFRAVLKQAGLNEKEWTPREMRHSFVSLLSDSGIPREEISRLVGHRNTSVTETVYRKQLRPMLLEGAEAMDQLFPD